ncbi:MAG TPA: hypothetical protein VHO50_01520 [Bacteroidales bacterium]|nr:hypothetical protein [Bacteroidales bacterium]
MRIFFPFIVVILLFTACNKDETTSDFIWNKSYGTGNAKSVCILNDTLIIACGQVDDKPFLVSLHRDYKERTLINPDYNGLFSSCYTDTSGFFIAGSKSNALLITHYDLGGSFAWEDTVKTGFNVESARLLSVNSGLLAIATPDPDSLDNGDTGYMFVKFDTASRIIRKKKITAPGRYISVADAVTDNAGNIYLALTYKTPGLKSYSAVAAYSADLSLLWESTIFNNRAFTSAALAIETDGTNKVFAGGKTENSTQNGTMVNSFLVALNINNGNLSGDWPQKRYLELWNEGSSIIKDNNTLLYLNKNCFIVNEINPSNGTDVDLLRPFSLCVSESTDSFSSDFAIHEDNKLIIAGSQAGNFSLCVKVFR